MPILYLFATTIMGVVLGLIVGWLTGLIMMFMGFGAYSFLAAAIVWCVISVIGFIVGLVYYNK